MSDLRRVVRFTCLTVLAFLPIIGCGEAGSSGGPPPRQAVLVDVERVWEGPIASSISATGTITAKEEVKVIAQTEGKIERLPVEEGDHVTAGQVLVQLDASVLSAQTKEAEATMLDAKQAFDRATSLFDSKLISRQEYDQARTRFQVAQARHEYQKVLLGYTTIRSPLSGVVTFRGARVGDVAVPRTVLLVVADLNTLVIEITVSELDVPKIRVGDPAVISVDAYPARSFGGEVRRIFPSSDPVSRLVKVEVVLTEQSDLLFPGLFARAQLTTDRKSYATLVSNDAVITSGTGETYVFAVVDSTVQRRTVALGIRSGNISEIVDGVETGDKLVIAGQSSLNDGMAVSVTRERERSDHADAS